MILDLSPPLQIKVNGNKQDETLLKMIPMISNVETVINNWYRIISPKEKSDWIYYFSIMYRVVRANRTR